MNNSVSRVEMKRYVDAKIDNAIGVFKEFLEDNFRGLREGQQMIIEGHERFELETGRHFRNIDDHLLRVDVRLDSMDNHLSSVDARLDSMDDHLNIIDSRLDSIESHLTETDSRLENIGGHLTNIDSRLSNVK